MPTQNLLPKLAQLIRHEDAPNGDITSSAIFGRNSKTVQATLLTKSDLVLSGIDAAQELIKSEFPKLKLTFKTKAGTRLRRGQIFGTLSGPIADVLTAERLILNLLQRFSGIATLTAQFVAATKSTQILDTRKTMPGWRYWERRAVVDGGGKNHRSDLSDAYMIKDNHVAAAGSVAQAIELVKAHQEKQKNKRPIIVEVDSLKQFGEALSFYPDVILLDNMKPAQIKQAIKLRNVIGKKPLLEISGGVTLKNIASFAKLGVDRISIGALTHSAPAVDISLEIE